MRPIGKYWEVPANLPWERWHGGELLAWRVWKLIRGDDGGLRLTSHARSTVWDGPVLTADHRPYPVADCGSGIYALKPSARVRRHTYFDPMLADPFARVATEGRASLPAMAIATTPSGVSGL